MERAGTNYKEAVASDGKRVSQVAENKILDIKKTDYTFNELFNEWFKDLPTVKSLKYYNVLVIHLNSFCSVFGDRKIDSINSLDLKNYQLARKNKGLSNSYIDQEIGSARNMLNTAWEIDKVHGDVLKPFKRIKKLMKKNENARDITISLESFNAMAESMPKYARDIISTAFYTGMRREEILGLTWDRVDLEKKVIILEAKHTKTNRKRYVPICDTLLSILMSIPNDYDYVFIYKGFPLKDIRGAMRTACTKIGIPYGRNSEGGMTFHDFRHTFVTNMRRSGINDRVAMSITGHSDTSMIGRYDTISLHDQLEAVNHMDKNISKDAKHEK